MPEIQKLKQKCLKYKTLLRNQSVENEDLKRQLSALKEKLSRADSFEKHNEILTKKMAEMKIKINEAQDEIKALKEKVDSMEKSKIKQELDLQKLAKNNMSMKRRLRQILRFNINRHLADRRINDRGQEQNQVNQDNEEPEPQEEGEEPAAPILLPVMPQPIPPNNDEARRPLTIRLVSRNRRTRMVRVRRLSNNGGASPPTVNNPARNLRRPRSPAPSSSRGVEGQGKHGKKSEKSCLCGKSFKTVSDLQRHFNLKIRGLLACDFPGCRKKFELDQDAKKHKIRDHAGHKPFPCNGCKQFFDSVLDKELHRQQLNCLATRVSRGIGYASIRYPDDNEINLRLTSSDEEED